jgi:biotin carboxylase
MKKLLMLGGAYFQIPAIKKAKEMGYYVITCDYLVNNPGHRFADEFYNISTTDKEAVLNLAKSLQIDGIMCYAADSGAPTVAYVAEKLGLPSHPYKSVEILTNKDKFREFQKENNFNTPKAKGYSTLEEAKADFHNFNMPVMIKPVDSSGSKGISKIDKIELLDEKVKNSLSFSKVKRFIIEEYIECFGPHVGGDGFSVDGKLVFRCFSNEYFSTNHLNPFVSIFASWPYIMPKHLHNKIHNEIQRVLNLLNMKTGAFNFDIRIDDNENVYLIEIAPRNGGDWNPNAIKYATGIDTIEYMIKAAVGEDCSDLTMVEPHGYWGSFVLNSQKNGVFKGVEIEDCFKKNNLVEYELVVKKGEHVSCLTGSHEKVGIMILKFSTLDEMMDKVRNFNKWVKVLVEEPALSDVTNVK